MSAGYESLIRHTKLVLDGSQKAIRVAPPRYKLFVAVGLAVVIVSATIILEIDKQIKKPKQ